ncbi:hypothetical protein, partial [Pseudomonas fluorescens]|uniref:hypothetical protein n=1 Tax=Pseudomonas fluorescens TaxID=294 RepID=UPI001F43E8E2
PKRQFIDAQSVMNFTTATFQTFFSFLTWRFAIGELPSTEPSTVAGKLPFKGAVHCSRPLVHPALSRVMR